MRDSSYLSANLVPQDLDRAVLLIEHEGSNFVELSRITGLDPKTDFQYVDLSFVDFSDCDLRGFNFTGSCLLGTSGNNVMWDQTTILDGAEIDGSSIFAAMTEIKEENVLSEEFFRQHWTDLVIWIEKRAALSVDYTDDAKKLLEVFLRSNDAFVRRTALKTLANYLSTERIVGIIDAHVLRGEKRDLILSAFELLGNLFAKSPQTVTRVALAHLNGPWAAEAAMMLAQHLPTERQLRHLTELMSRHESGVVRRRFIAELAEKRGEALAFIVRDPRTGDVFDFGEHIDLELLDLVTRAVVRRRRDEIDYMDGRLLYAPGWSLDRVTYSGAIAAEFTSKTVEGVRIEVEVLLRKFNEVGLKFSFPRSAFLSFRKTFQFSSGENS